MQNFPDAARQRLPSPFRKANFTLRKQGVFDEPGVSVFVDDEACFAVLDPCPVMDYVHYLPRHARLGLGNYRKSLDVVAQRIAKIDDLIPQAGLVLEVGAANGAFLGALGQRHPNLSLIAVEPDLETKAGRAEFGLAGDYASLEQVAAAGVKADLVCMFHVFEHIAEPDVFLAAVRRVLAPGGRLLIEVPSLDDPLLSLYRSPAYEEFYFQRQHPFVYSSRSLRMVLEKEGWRVLEMRPYQRYGMENHLGWLTKGKPGGDTALAAIFAGSDSAYRASLEANGTTDTIFAIAEVA
ncbi:MAG: class I SAM-dependent methyltransferase [Pseudolabrys sp.]|nr:class I SAM-dependent methyltransferase [Pseudolabrys sp.]